MTVAGLPVPVRWPPGRQRRGSAPDSASGHAELLKSHGHLGGIA
ncbi:hypothetical protein NB691_002601 [Xanthomonas sacchari]|nr:hypothetical protein [Xanthomonas sacchari]